MIPVYLQESFFIKSEKTMAEINLKELIKAILLRWWIIIICVALSTGASIFYNKYKIVPVYSANATIYVGKNIESNAFQANDLYIGSALISDYREIAKSRRVATRVIKELEIPYMTPSAMSSMIGVNQKGDTRFIEININSTKPVLAMDIANKVAEVLQEQIKEIIKIENVQIIDRAVLPRFPIATNERRNQIIGVMLGLVIGAFIAYIIDYMDDTIKTPEDVINAVNIPVIGTIPVFQTKGKGI